VSFVEEEIASQPASWRRAAELSTRLSAPLPGRGGRVAVVGCGTSLFIGQSMAALREASGDGETDAFPASELPAGRRYDLVVALSRSGTTSEVLKALDVLAGMPTLAITADGGAPLAARADRAVVLDFADERSVVQTRFATTALALARARLGHSLGLAAADAEDALEAPLPESADEVAFLGTGWRVGLAREAALKVREAAGPGAGDFLFVAVGTGIGAAFVAGGAPYRGAHGRAGELGHTVVEPDGPPCECGGRGHLEAIASAAAIERAYAEAGGADGASAREVAELAGAHDPIAREIWDRAVAALASALASSVAVLDPALVVLGGGLADAGPALFEPLSAAVAERVTLGAPPPIVPAALGAEAGCRGAALLAWRALAPG